MSQYVKGENNMKTELIFGELSGGGIELNPTCSTTYKTQTTRTLTIDLTKKYLITGEVKYSTTICPFVFYIDCGVLTEVYKDSSFSTYGTYTYTDGSTSFTMDRQYTGNFDIWQIQLAD